MDGSRKLEVELPAGEQRRLGRGADNDVRLEHGDVSRNHLALRVESGVVQVRDLGARNGTRLRNGDGVTSVAPGRWTPVPAGARVEIGRGVAIEPRLVPLGAERRVSDPASASDPCRAGTDRLPTLTDADPGEALLGALLRLQREVLARGLDRAVLSTCLEDLGRAIEGCGAIGARLGSPDDLLLLPVVSEGRMARAAGAAHGDAPRAASSREPDAAARDRLEVLAGQLRRIQAEPRDADACRAQALWHDDDAGLAALVVDRGRSVAIAVSFDEGATHPGRLVVDALQSVVLQLAAALDGAPPPPNELPAQPTGTGERGAAPSAARHVFPGLVRAPALREALMLAERAAPKRHPILLLGETGSGKNLLARFIHDASGRPGKFVAVSVTELVPTLVEAELFGHGKGAFTGAVGSREGRILAADGGTLFLDEIGEIAPEMQAKLLRVLETGFVEPVGTDERKPVDLRIVAATNRDLRAAMRANDFREDLFHRISTITIRVPPLRERREDILPLARAALQREETDKIFDRTGIDWLLAQEWPGNVRELENRVARAALRAEGRIVSADHLIEEDEPTPRASPFGLRWNDAREAFERDYCERLLIATDGNVTEASRLSGIERGNLYKKLKKHGLRPDLERDDELMQDA